MKESIRIELKSHIMDAINDRVITNDNKDEWHFECFNRDYYLIGYNNCTEWLRFHGLVELEAAGICQQYEIDNFGESKVYDNSESVVNMLAYIYGEELIHDIDAIDIDELTNQL